MAKVKFGIEQIHLFPLTDEEAMTYGTPIACPGAISLTLNVSESSADPFYADDGVYYLPAGKSSGYTGTLEVAIIPDEVKLALMAFIKDSANVIVEVADAIAKPFAMTFQIPTDEKARKLVFYNCQFGRPGLSAKTQEGSKTPETESADLTIMPTKKTFKLNQGGEQVETTVISGYSTSETSSEVYTNWHTSVHLPTSSEG